MRRQQLEAAHRVNPEEVTVSVSVGQVELADISFGQDGLENVELIGIVHDLLEDQFGVAEEGHLLLEGLHVAVHQESVNANADAVLADEGDFVLQTVLDNLVQVFQQGYFLTFEEVVAGVRRVVVRPEGADIDARGLGHINEGRQAPEEGAIDAHEVLGHQVVGLIEDDTDLGLPTFQLSEEHLQLKTDVQLGGIKNHENEVRAIDKPLAHVVEWVTLKWEKKYKELIIIYKLRC